jgi:hypothetical protein
MPWLVRYADDCCLTVEDTRADAEVPKDEIAGVVPAIGLRLSPGGSFSPAVGPGIPRDGHTRPFGLARRRCSACSTISGRENYLLAGPVPSARRAIARNMAIP